MRFLLLACKGRVLSSPTVATGAQPGKAACLLPAAWPSSRLRTGTRAPFSPFPSTHRPRRHIGFSSHKMIHTDERARRGAGARARGTPVARAPRTRGHSLCGVRSDDDAPTDDHTVPTRRIRSSGCAAGGTALHSVAYRYPAPSVKSHAPSPQPRGGRAAVAPRAEKRHARVRPSAGLNPAPPPFHPVHTRTPLIDPRPRRHAAMPAACCLSADVSSTTAVSAASSRRSSPPTSEPPPACSIPAAGTPRPRRRRPRRRRRRRRAARVARA